MGWTLVSLIGQFCEASGTSMGSEPSSVAYLQETLRQPLKAGTFLRREGGPPLCLPNFETVIGNCKESS